MNRYSVRLLVPETITIEAEDLGKAHTEALRLSRRNENIETEDYGTKLLSCTEIREEALLDVEVEFEPLPDPPVAA